jgi:hypothetical protein
MGRQVWTTFDVADPVTGEVVESTWGYGQGQVRKYDSSTHEFAVLFESDGDEITFPAPKIYAMLAPQETTEYDKEQHTRRVQVCEAVRRFWLDGGNKFATMLRFDAAKATLCGVASALYKTGGLQKRIHESFMEQTPKSVQNVLKFKVSNSPLKFLLEGVSLVSLRHAADTRLLEWMESHAEIWLMNVCDAIAEHDRREIHAQDILSRLVPLLQCASVPEQCKERYVYQQLNISTTESLTKFCRRKTGWKSYSDHEWKILEWTENNGETLLQQMTGTRVHYLNTLKAMQTIVGDVKDVMQHVGNEVLRDEVFATLGIQSTQSLTAFCLRDNESTCVKPYSLFEHKLLRWAEVGGRNMRDKMQHNMKEYAAREQSVQEIVTTVTQLLEHPGNESVRCEVFRSLEIDSLQPLNLFCKRTAGSPAQSTVRQRIMNFGKWKDVCDTLQYNAKKYIGREQSVQERVTIAKQLLEQPGSEIQRAEVFKSLQIDSTKPLTLFCKRTPESKAQTVVEQRIMNFGKWTDVCDTMQCKVNEYIGREQSIQEMVTIAKPLLKHPGSEILRAKVFKSLQIDSMKPLTMFCKRTPGSKAQTAVEQRIMNFENWKDVCGDLEDNRASYQSRVKRAQDAIRVVLDYLQLEVDRKKLAPKLAPIKNRAVVVDGDTLFSKMELLHHFEVATTCQFTKFANGNMHNKHVMSADIVANIVAWTETNTDRIIEAKSFMTAVHAIIQPVKSRNMYTVETLFNVVKAKQTSSGSMQQVTSGIDAGQRLCVRDKFVQATPQRNVTRLAENAIATVITTKQAEILKRAITVCVLIDGGVTRSGSARKGTLFRRVTAYIAHDNSRLEKLAQNVTTLESKMSSLTQQETKHLEWLQLQIRIKGKPVNFTCGAFAAMDNAVDTQAYVDGIKAALETFGIPLSKLLCVCGDSASVISSAATSLATKLGKPILRVKEWHHAISRAMKLASQEAFANGLDTESPGEAAWQRGLRVVRQHFPTFLRVYERVAVERHVVLANIVPVPKQWPETRFLGQQKSIVDYFDTIAKLELFLEAVRILAVEDTPNRLEWGRVQHDFAPVDVQMELLLNSIIYLQAVKHAHISALDLHEWNTPFLPRLLETMLGRLAVVKSVVMVEPGMTDWLVGHGLTQTAQDACVKFARRARAQLLKTFEYFTTTIMKFAGLGDYKDPEFAQRAMQLHFERYQDDRAYDTIGIFACEEEVMDVITGKRGLYQCPHMLSVYAPLFWGSIFPFSQQLEGDVQIARKTGTASADLSTRNRKLVLRDMASPDPVVNIANEKNAVLDALRDERVARQQTEAARSPTYGVDGLTQDRGLFFLRALAYLRQAATDEKLVTSTTLSMVDSPEYNARHEVTIGPSDSAGIVAHMATKMKLSTSQLQELVQGDAQGQCTKFLQHYSSGRRRSSRIPEYHTAFKFLAPMLLELQDDTWYTCPGGLFINPECVLMANTVEALVCDAGTHEVVGVMLSVTRSDENFKALDNRVLGKAQEAMGTTGLLRCWIVEMFVAKGYARRTIMENHIAKKGVNIQRYVDRKYVMWKATTVLFEPAKWAPALAMKHAFIIQDLLPLLQTGVDRYDPASVETVAQLFDTANELQSKGGSRWCARPR